MAQINAPKQGTVSTFAYHDLHAERTKDGYHCIPIKAGAKHPARWNGTAWEGLKGWTSYCDAPPDLATREAWGAMKDHAGRGAGMGFALGNPAGEDDDGTPLVVVAIDDDRADPATGPDWLEVAMGRLAPDAPRKVGATGSTWLMVMPVADAASRDFTGPGGTIQLLGRGKQTVVPPSLHPNGQAYRWLSTLYAVAGLPVVTLAELTIAMGAGGFHAGLKDRPKDEGRYAAAMAKIEDGTVRASLEAALAAGELPHLDLMDLWTNGADAAVFATPVLSGKAGAVVQKARDTSGNARRLELARGTRRLGFNGAEFTAACRVWSHAEGAHKVRERDYARAWADSAGMPVGDGKALAALPVAELAAEGGGSTAAQRTVRKIAEYSASFPCVVAGDAVKVAVRTVLPGGGTDLRLLSRQGFADALPGDGESDPRRGFQHYANAWWNHPSRDVRTGGLRFMPGVAQDAARPFCNTWTEWPLTPAEAGSCDLFKRHLADRVCSGDAGHFAYLWGWLAHMLQRPMEKPGVAVVLTGARGTGKSMVGEAMARIIGRAHFASVSDQSHLTGRFNGHLADALLIRFEEAIWTTNKAAENKLKDIITSDTLAIERKGADAVMQPHYGRVLVTSNDDVAVPAGVGERRFFCLDMPGGRMAKADGAALAACIRDDGAMRRLMWELLAADLAGFDPHRCPETAALARHKEHNAEPLELWWADLPDAGGTWAPRDDGVIEVAAGVVMADFRKHPACRPHHVLSHKSLRRFLERQGCGWKRTKDGASYTLPEVDPLA